MMAKLYIFLVCALIQTHTAFALVAVSVPSIPPPDNERQALPPAPEEAPMPPAKPLSDQMPSSVEYPTYLPEAEPAMMIDRVEIRPWYGDIEVQILITFTVLLVIYIATSDYLSIKNGGSAFTGKDALRVFGKIGILVGAAVTFQLIYMWVMKSAL